MGVITTIEDLRQIYRRRVPRMFHDYAESGSWTEQTFRENTTDFAEIRLRQRVAVDMSGRSTASTMAGQDVAMPVALAPVGLTGMQHADGEILAARAAEAAGVPFTLSTMSICSIEDVARHATKPFWFQIYALNDDAFNAAIINRAANIERETDVGRLRARRACRLSQDRAPEVGKDRLPLGRAERQEPHRRAHDLRGKPVEPERQHRFRRKRKRHRRPADRDRIGQGAGRRAPGDAVHARDEGRADLLGLDQTLGRDGEGAREVRKMRKIGARVARPRQQHRIRPPRAVADRGLGPGRDAAAVAHDALRDRRFEPLRKGEPPDRKGGREPLVEVQKVALAPAARAISAHAPRRGGDGRGRGARRRRGGGRACGHGHRRRPRA